METQRPYRLSEMVKASMRSSADRLPASHMSFNEPQTHPWSTQGEYHSGNNSSDTDTDSNGSVLARKEPPQARPSPPGEDEVSDENAASLLISMRSPKTGTEKDPSDENAAKLLMSFRSPEAAPGSVNTLGSAAASASNDRPNRMLPISQLLGPAEPERVEATLDDDTDAVDPELDERTAEVRCRDGSSAQVVASATSAVWGLAEGRLTERMPPQTLAEDEPEALSSVGDGSEEGEDEDEEGVEEGDEDPEVFTSTNANDRDDPDGQIGSSSYNPLPAIPPTNSSDPDAHIDKILHVQRPETYHTFIHMMQTNMLVTGTMANVKGHRKPKNKVGHPLDKLVQLRGEVPIKRVRWIEPPVRPEFQCALVKKPSRRAMRREALEAAAAAADEAGPSTKPSSKKRKTTASTATTMVPISPYAPTANLPTIEAPPRKRRKVAASAASDVAGKRATGVYPTPPDDVAPGEDLELLAGSGMRAQKPESSMKGKGKEKEEVRGKSTTTTRSGRMSKKVERLVEELDVVG
ncbi:MAG: hypothetical protein Q9209_004020 [Squamulea sp. 1 TL-2023]